MALKDALQHAWNAFASRDPTFYRPNMGQGSSRKPDRVRFTRGIDKSIVTTIYTRIAMDCASIEVKHVRLDENDRYVYDMDTELQDCLTVEANLDQTPTAFIQDVVMSMFDEGCVAIVPIDTEYDPLSTDAYKIYSMRVGKIVEWFPRHVRIDVYNDRTGRHQQIIKEKREVAIIENPFYAIVNEPNSTSQRLIRKLALMDTVDEQTSAGKLDLIIQLPYIIKTDARRQQAEQRRKDIEMQLAGSKYGIAYTDGTERITQLNRSLENNLLKQIEYLTSMLYSQLGITEEILNGSANEETMLNYRKRVIEPIMSAIVDEMKRKFLTKTARTQKQSILFFDNPFKLVPVSQVADIGDKMLRNQIMSSNEMRQVIGLKPSLDPQADRLQNPNLNQMEGQEFANTGAEGEEDVPVDEGY